jgi:predicted lipase
MYDVMNDINFIQERMELDAADVPEIKVHKGFHQDFKDIKPFLSTLINENPNIKNIYFTGHSRGSSVSTLSALYIKTVYPHLNVYNIGFGCPRLGCENFANYYNKLLRETTYLFREEKDIVTKLPIYGYYDIFNQYIIKDNKIVSMYESYDSVIEFMESGLEHHKLHNYMDCNYRNPKFFPL